MLVNVIRKLYVMLKIELKEQQEFNVFNFLDIFILLKIKVCLNCINLIIVKFLFRCYFIIFLGIYVNCYVQFVF